MTPDDTLSEEVLKSDHPVNQALLTLLENQAARTVAALEGLRDEVFARAPGGDCKSIREICRHLLLLRRFQLSLLESSRADQAADPESIETFEDVLPRLQRAEQLLREAIREHDPEDWYAVPSTPRPGKWGDEPTLDRFSRPFNDFVNHLGSIRAVRRILENPAERTQ